jgi:hypothetical protein
VCVCACVYACVCVCVCVCVCARVLVFANKKGAYRNQKSVCVLCVAALHELY